MTDEGAKEIAAAIRYLAHSVTASAATGTDAQGGSVESLTEAVMGVTAALTGIQSTLGFIKEMLELRE